MTYRLSIAASILDADFGHLADEVRRAVDAGVDRIHLDVMDARFVPNLTFGWQTIAAVRDVTDLPFDAHLMIAEPGRWIDRFIEAGCDSITFHVEVARRQIRPTLESIREAGKLAGLSVKPATPLTALRPYRELLDIVMVMTVEPGFGGQSFMEHVAEQKIAPARDHTAHRGASQVHVDGGGNRGSAPRIGAEGADVLVVGSALYGASDMRAEADAIRALAESSRAKLHAPVAAPEPS